MSDGRGDDEGAAGDEGRLLPGDAYERLALQWVSNCVAASIGSARTEALMDCASMVSDMEGARSCRWSFGGERRRFSSGPGWGKSRQPVVRNRLSAKGGALGAYLSALAFKFPPPVARRPPATNSPPSPATPSSRHGIHSFIAIESHALSKHRRRSAPRSRTRKLDPARSVPVCCLNLKRTARSFRCHVYFARVSTQTLP